MCRLICNLPELSIRIYQSACFLFLLIGMNFGSKILILYAVEFFAALNNTCISDRTIALLLLDVPSRKFFGFPYNYKTNAPLVQSIRTNKANVPADLQSAGI